MTLYEALTAAGCEIDHHESDLYVRVTPDSTRIVFGHFGRKVPRTPTEAERVAADLRRLNARHSQFSQFKLGIEAYGRRLRGAK